MPCKVEFSGHFFIAGLAAVNWLWMVVILQENFTLRQQSEARTGGVRIDKVPKNNMLYRKPLLFFSLIPIFIGVLGLYVNYSDKVEYDNGNNVYALVIEEPIDCDEINYKTSFIKLEYNNRTFIKKIGSDYCQNIGNSELLVRSNEGGNELFLLVKILTVILQRVF